jgi:hypothetical protein
MKERQNQKWKENTSPKQEKRKEKERNKMEKADSMIFWGESQSLLRIK